MFVESVTPAVGARVAVQVIPPSVDETVVRVALAMVRSSFAKPVTASEKVKVTKDVSPILRVVSVTMMAAVGADISRVTWLSVEVLAVFRLPTLSETLPAGMEAVTMPFPVIPLTETV